MRQHLCCVVLRSAIGRPQVTPYKRHTRKAPTVYNPLMDSNIYRNLLQILRRDSKDTTYKYALLRGLIEISTEYPHLIAQGKDYVNAPLGLLCEKWVFYYWPFIEKDIKQKHGETPERKIAFRQQFKELTDAYKSNGGYPQFDHDYREDRLPTDVANTYLVLLRKIRETIAKMPMKHLGQSVHKQLYYIVRPSNRMDLPKIKPSEISHLWVVQHFGSFELRVDYYDVFRKVGDLLLGTDSILYHWADFTARLKKDPPAPQDFEEAFNLLNRTFEHPRAVEDAKKLYAKPTPRQRVNCVWCGKSLAQKEVVIDHVLPYSHTQNNELWNLLPSCSQCNAKKKDSIPSPTLIKGKGPEIRRYWEMAREEYGSAFDQEVRYSLTGYEPAACAEDPTVYLAKRCEFLINERGYESWDKI